MLVAYEDNTGPLWSSGLLFSLPLCLSLSLVHARQMPLYLAFVFLAYWLKMQIEQELWVLLQLQLVYANVFLGSVFSKIKRVQLLRYYNMFWAGFGDLPCSCCYCVCRCVAK